MKIHPFSAMGILSLVVTVTATAKPKTITAEKVDPALIHSEPYRFNGIVLNGTGRGSGFCAWNQHAFFSAAHVVYGESWETPPLWLPTVNDSKLSEDDGIQTRGYYRWTDYAELVAEGGKAGAAFSKDVILGFSFKELIPGKPAHMNLQGGRDLPQGVKTMITGYPAKDPYKNKPIDGYFMHRTAPAITPFKSFSDRALYTTLITTGPGNSGGPIWTKDAKYGWTAAGVLVGGRPSECIVYAFSNEINSLTRAVEPIIARKPTGAIGVNGVSATSMFFPYTRDQVIPDGSHKWTNMKVGIKAFEKDSVLTMMKLSVNFETKHRGDLTVILAGPGGYETIVHNEEGAGKDNLIIKDRDLSEFFTGIDPNGTWILRVQDRLKGHVATLKSFRLEIAAKDAETVPAP